MIKKTILTLLILLVFFFQSFGQNNPITNLTWNHQYYNMTNYYQLQWDEPELPHDELIGYNVYGENLLFRFQTESTLFYLEQGTNCNQDFLLFNAGMPFTAHVTAVYAGQLESTYLQTAFIDGPLLKINNFVNQKAILYPNPTNGILNIENKNLNKILIYDISGKIIKEIEPKSQIDLLGISKGIYFIKLISGERIMIDKIIIQ